MDTITAIIVDDERLARANLRQLLRPHPRVSVVGEARDCAQARSLIASLDPDLVFLDIQLRGESGFDLLRDIGDRPRVIFVTAHDNYALRAFEVNAIDYLLKPVEPERLAKAIARAQAQPSVTFSPVEQYRYDDSVFLNTGRQTFVVPVAEIAAIRADGNYSHVLDAAGKDHMVRVKLSDWLARLPGDAFPALSRSLLINRNHITRWAVRARQADLYLGSSAAPLHLGRTAVRRLQQAVRGTRPG
ncbi:MAG: hypothetical protein A3K19_29600 [Lentisphaerae bacterium RIFOXYB12_FULL_65_16]|nr:MAG: hypothetical protein A3K18_29980 [Lentisphaerae bacterium RIFOXYA12_64_32]OGV87064.1 MAG: hypothetical protein A3K19_29600 [Lentisphaerae bacterium RIFOXYB12_FULL_65_16]